MRAMLHRATVAVAAACAVLHPDRATAEDPGLSGIDWQVGGFVSVAPKFEGSSDYRVMGFPFVAPAGIGGGSGEGRLQVRGPDDVRLRLFQGGGFEAGPVAGWRFDRDQSDALRLRGLGDVDGGLLLGGYMAYRFGIVAPFVSYAHQVTGDDNGGVLRFGLEARGQISPGFWLTATTGATYADDSYMDSYFSISRRQSARSLLGLRRFDADAEVKDAYLGLGLDIPLSSVWTLKLSGRYTHLLGDAAASPIVESESQFSGTIGITYRFGASQ
jgi:outer membrane protein